MPPKPSAPVAVSQKPKGKPGSGQGKPSAKPRAPLPIAERIKRLFTSLCAQVDGGYFANAVKTCDKILRLQPDDKDAWQTKLFLLLQTEQYSPALAMIEQRADGHAYEKAYSLYRLQRETEAHAIMDELKAADPDDRGVIHLESQMAYRRGDYGAATELYTQLLDTAEPNSEEHADVYTNLQAAQKHLDFIESSFMRAVDALPATVLASLETVAPPQPSHITSAVALSASAAAAPVAPLPQKKVRAKRVPKGVVPGITPPPDPERWLKKAERSTFVHKKVRGHKAGGATQGIVLDAPTGPGPVSGGGAVKGGKAKKKK